MSENKFTINKNTLNVLSDIMDNLELDEVELKANDSYVRFARNGNKNKGSRNETVDSKIINAKHLADEIKSKEYIINAPVVGRVYLSPGPNAMPFVKIGDSIKKGQVILIIEAMKVMNNVKADKDGIVKKVLVKNEEPVEYGQPLIILE